MTSESFDFLKRFLDCGTPSGYETWGQKVWLEYVGKYADKCDTDAMGNAWARSVRPSFPAKTIMVVGHCDEIGLMATHITDKGFIHFAPIGGVDVEILQGTRVKFHGTGVTGIIGRRPIHLQEQEEDKEKTKIKVHQLWIDIGASTKETASKMIPVGSVAYMQSGSPLLLPGGEILSSRGLDDKVGAFVAAEVVRHAHEAGLEQPVIVGVSTVQEEIGLCGAKTVANIIKPDVAIVVDVGFATDTPDEDDAKKVGDISLGKGPAVAVGAACNKVLLDCTMLAAEERGIKIQIAPEPNETGTDADAIRLTSVGIPTINISVPVRYMHTPVEACSLLDVESAANLIYYAAVKMGGMDSFKPLER
jgi:endoglucanase